jgi:hypothetical protein
MTYTEDIRTIEIKVRLRKEIESLKKALERDDKALLEAVNGTAEVMSRWANAMAFDLQSSRDNIHRKLDELIKTANLELGELTVTYQFDRQTITSRGGTMFTLTDIQQVHARATFKDSRGNPAEVDMANIQWSSSDETKITATPDTDGSGGCTFAAVGPLTDPATPVQISVTDGNLTITDTIAVTASAATTVGIEFETASPEQPPTP